MIPCRSYCSPFLCEVGFMSNSYVVVSQKRDGDPQKVHLILGNPHVDVAGLSKCLGRTTFQAPTKIGTFDHLPMYPCVGLVQTPGNLGNSYGKSPIVRFYLMASRISTPNTRAHPYSLGNHIYTPANL